MVWYAESKGVSGMKAEEIILGEDGKYFLNSGIDRSDGTPVRPELRAIHIVSWTSVYLAWLVLLTPRGRLRRFWWYAILAGLLLWLTQIAYFTANTTNHVATMYQRTYGDNPILEAETISSIDKLLRGYTLTLHHALPFMLYAPVFFFPMRERPTRWTPTGDNTPSRKAPCPCGSGKKFKRCCGG